MTNQSRRDFLVSAVGTGAVGVAALGSLPTTAEAVTATRRLYKLSKEELQSRFKDPIWNREMSARIEADIAPGKYVNGYVTGTVMGVRDNEAVRPLFGFEVFSSIRVLKQSNGDYQRLCRELIFYKDLTTGE